MCVTLQGSGVSKAEGHLWMKESKVKLGRLYNGSTFVFSSGDCPFDPEPTPTSADACGKVTDHVVGCQEVTR